MSLTIRCDAVNGSSFRCDEQLTGLGFNAKPANWYVAILNEHGDHMDYCPKHATERKFNNKGEK